MASGGLSGGIGSSIAGGRFWDGVRNGVISAGLNHAAHQIANAIAKDPPNPYEDYFRRVKERIEGILSEYKSFYDSVSNNGWTGRFAGLASLGLSHSHSVWAKNLVSRLNTKVYGSNGSLIGQWRVSSFQNSGTPFIRNFTQVGFQSVGRTLALLGFAHSSYQFANGQISGTRYFGDTLATSVMSFGGIYGWAIGGIYFLGTWAIDNGYISGSPSRYSNWRNTCFVAGTKILMFDGTEKNIEDIQLYDKILSVNMSIMKIEPDEVKIIPKTSEFYNQILFSFENGTELISSPHHPIYIKDKGWCVYDVEMARRDLSFKVGEIQIGDVALFYSGSGLIKVKINKIKDLGKKVQMYNIKYVKRNNTFFANKVLVHNRFDNNNK